MTKLETYLNQLNNSDYDFQDYNQINKELSDIAELLREEGQEEQYKQALLDGYAFSINKSFIYTDNKEEGQVRGLCYRLRGVNKLKDGAEEPFFWPDVTKLTDDDFHHFELRYKEAVNLYVKSEYGLLVYFGARTIFSNHLDFKAELFDILFKLSKQYYDKREQDFSYAYRSNIVLELAWGIATESKLNDKVGVLSNYMHNIVVSSDITIDSEIWILVSYSNVLLNNFSEAKLYIDFNSVINKTFDAAKEKEKIDFDGALYIADLCVNLAQKMRIDKKQYLLYKAELYEKMALEAELHSSMMAVQFAEKALLLYKDLKKNDDIKRLERYYDKVRGQVEMSEVYHELPDEYVQKLQEYIQNKVSVSNEREVIRHFVETPWYKTIDEIRGQANKVKEYSVLQSFAPVRVMDKFGNAVAEYITDEERDEFRFWETYGYYFQLGSGTMHRFFIEGYKEGKLSYDTVVSYLEATWLNEPIGRRYIDGRDKIEIVPLDLLKPGLKRIFLELELFDSDNNHQYDTVTIIDSLTLKIESLLRFFCEKIDIPTFKPRGKGNSKVIMEKLLDDMLSDIEHMPKHNPNQITGFDEEDRVMLKYVLTEKAGYNLRNKVAHGLMDVFEYEFQLVVILFSLVLKLSKYSFTEINGGEDESNS